MEIKDFKQKLINGEDVTFSNNEDILEVLYTKKSMRFLLVFNGVLYGSSENVNYIFNLTKHFIDKYNLTKETTTN